MSLSAPPFTYKELKIVISPGEPGKFRVRAESEQGSTPGVLELPFSAEALPALLKDLARAVLPTVADLPSQTREAKPEAPVGGPPRIDPRAFGVQLYKALFRDDVQRLLDKTRGSIEGQSDVGLRLRISFETTREDMSLVMSLPWELLAESASERPMTVSRRFPMVRALDVMKPTTRTPVEQLFKVLVIVATPKGVPKLDLEAEKSKIKNEWAGLKGVELSMTRGVMEDVRRMLVNDDPHIIHFMGHGDFKNGRGALLFETATGEVDLVDGEEFGLLLSDERALRLVFLNACQTAETGAVGGTDPFAGVATALVRAGVTAVLAMQFPISDRTAIVFANTFYRSIVDGQPVDGAVGEARKEVFSSKHAEWATPVLFMRSDDGVLFDRESSSAPSHTVSVTQPTTAATDDFTVFIAATSDRMRTWAKRAIRELPTRGMTIVEAEATPMAEHEAAMRALAGSADLFVHVLGDQPGEAVDGAPDARSYPMEQFRIGHQASKAQLVFLPMGLTSSGVTDQAYKTFLQDIEARPRDASQLEVITTDIDAMVGEIVRKREALQQPTGPRAVSMVYLDVHQRDVAALAPIQAALTARAITWISMPAGDTTPREAMDLFAQAVRQVPLVLVVAGTVEGTWVKNRVLNAINVGASYDNPPGVAVIRVPGSATPPKLPGGARVLGDGVTFDEAGLDALLAETAKGLS